MNSIRNTISLLPVQKYNFTACPLVDICAVNDFYQSSSAWALDESGCVWEWSAGRGFDRCNQMSVFGSYSPYSSTCQDRVQISSEFSRIKGSSHPRVCYITLQHKLFVYDARTQRSHCCHTNRKVGDSCAPFTSIECVPKVAGSSEDLLLLSHSRDVVAVDSRLYGCFLGVFILCLHFFMFFISPEKFYFHLC